MLWRTSEKQTISYNIASEHKSLPWSEGSNLLLSESAAMHADLQKKKGQVLGDLKLFTPCECCLQIFIILKQTVNVEIVTRWLYKPAVVVIHKLFGKAFAALGVLIPRGFSSLTRRSCNVR